MNKKKKLFSMLLTLALMGSSMACSDKPAQKTDNNNPSSNEQIKMTLIAYPQAGFSAINGSDTQKYIEDKFNVKFDIITLDSFNTEAFNVFWAQGGKADVLFTTRVANNLIDQGVFREIKEADLYEKMPTWMSKMEELVGDATLLKTLMKYNGKNYCIPFTNGAFTESGLMIARKDWMDKVGITKEPETLEEFEAMLDAFTKKDPDGNGKDDTYGIHGGQRYHFNYVWGAYGIMPKSYILNNQKVEFTSATETYRSVIKLLAKWYKNGYIDPEFVTDDRTMQRNKWSEGKLGILADNAFWIDSARGENGVLSMLELKDKNAKFVFLKPFKGETGLSGSYLDYPGVTGDGAIYFGAEASDGIVGRMMEIKEQFASDWELYKRCYYGVKDKHYTEDSNGKITISSDVNAEIITNTGIRQTFALMPVTLDWMKKTMNERDELAHSQSLSQPVVYTGIAFPVSQENQAVKLKGEDVTKVVDEYYINAVTGKVDIDKTWEDYLKLLSDAGLTEIIEGYQTIYNNSK